jgi:hypothetical protein
MPFMRFEFSEKSGLHGRKLNLPIDRFAYVPQSEIGMKEYIFGYNVKVPTAIDEPELYRDAEVSSDKPNEVVLKYGALDEMVILLTLESDNAFRAANAELVSQNELFKIES